MVVTPPSLALVAAVLAGALAWAAPALSKSAASEPAAPSAFRVAPCAQVVGYTLDRLSCGYLDVQESAQGRDLALAVAIIAAAKQDSAKEPVVFAHGGPGGDVVAAAHSFMRHPMTRTRSLILFDQRGSGASLPRDCPNAAQDFTTLLAADLDAATATAAQADIEGGCRATMVRDGADLNGYGTRQTVGDMEVLRQALGIDVWNVMGVSYGTTVALDYVRMHPQRTRALVLDSVYPLSYAPGGDAAARAFGLALEQLYADCRADAACHRAFRDLEASFLDALLALERQALAIPVADRGLVASGVFFLNPQDLALIVQQMLYQRQTIALVPKVIDLAAERNGPALAGLVNLLGPQAQRVNLTARLAVECRERWRMPGRTRTDLTQTERILRRNLTLFDTEDILCPDWAQHTGAAFNAPVSSPVPALFYSGSHDPITPVENTQQTFRRFAAGHYVHVLHTGHGVDRTHACVQRLTAAFLNDPRAPLYDTCTGTIAPIAFVTDVAASPGVMRFAMRILQMQSPGAVGLLVVGALLMYGGLVWMLVQLLRRLGRRRPPAPEPAPEPAPAAAMVYVATGFLGTAAVTLTVFMLGLIEAIVQAGTGPTPAILALGLPVEKAWLLQIPAIALALIGIGGLATLPVVMRRAAMPRAAWPLLALTSGGGVIAAMLWVLGFVQAVPG